MERYAGLLIRTGVNLQPGQPLRLALNWNMPRLCGWPQLPPIKRGRYVHVDWDDAPLKKQRLLYSSSDYLEFFTNYEVVRHQEMVDETWARLALVGDAHPDLFDDVDPGRMMTVAKVRAQKIKPYSQAQMANHLQWCVAAVPTAAWARKVFPELGDQAAIDELWQLIFRTCRVNEADPVAAWQQHNQTLNRIVDFLHRHDVRTVRFLDSELDLDGKPRTDLTVGMTDAPRWISAGTTRPDGLFFFPNMPTEEIFSTPHNARTTGWVRTSKPTFPLERRVEDAWFRFEAGEVVEFSARVGKDVLEQSFAIRGAKRLGEVALVDVRSPINQAGITFYEILFDENATCHIAFGEAYPEGLRGSESMSEEELEAQGVNMSDTHVDFMIGTPTMKLIGHCADGREIVLMEDGKFAEQVLQGG
ncbi:MAG: aminopeptidase [Caldilineaceae bacterium]